MTFFHHFVVQVSCDCVETQCNHWPRVAFTHNFASTMSKSTSYMSFLGFHAFLEVVVMIVEKGIEPTTYLQKVEYNVIFSFA